MKKFVLLASTLSLLATPLFNATECFGQAGLVPPPPPTAIPPKPVAPPAVVISDDKILVDQSKPLVANDNNKQQRFIDYIDLKPGQESLPLTITFTNGGDGAAFKWLRVSIAGGPYYTEADFKNNQMALDISGKVGAGSNQIVVLGSGEKGSTLSWSITAPKPVLKSTQPKDANIGDNLTITGLNFSANPTADVVTFGETKAQVVSASPTTIVCKIPDSLKPGDTPVNVTVLGVKGKAITIKVKGRIPAELTELVGSGFNWTDRIQSAPPGTPITVRGKNFGDSKAKVKVFFGDVEAPVSSRSDTEIVTSIPMGLEGNDPSWGVPISVVVDEVRSKNFLNINVQSRVW